MAVPGITELEGSRLKMARRWKGYSLEELGIATAIDAQKIDDWETKAAWCQSEETIAQLAAAMGCLPGLLSGSEMDDMGDDFCSYRPFVDGSGGTYDAGGMAEFGIRCAICEVYAVIELEDTSDVQAAADNHFEQLGWSVGDEIDLCPQCARME